MPDPNFEKPSRPGPQIYGSVDANAPGAETKIEAGLARQLGLTPGAGVADLRQFVQKDYRVQSFSLVGARTDELLSFPRMFSFIFVPNSTNTTDLMQIRIGSASADAIPFLPGTKINGIPFERLYLTNAAIAGATMTIMFAENWPVDQIDTDS